MDDFTRTLDKAMKNPEFRELWEADEEEYRQLVEERYDALERCFEKRELGALKGQFTVPEEGSGDAEVEEMFMKEDL